MSDPTVLLISFSSQRYLTLHQLPHLFPGDVIQIKEYIESNWWKCFINGNEAKIHVSNVYFASTTQSRSTGSGDRRTRSGGLILEQNPTSPRSNDPQTPTGIEYDSKKNGSFVTKATTKLMKGMDVFKNRSETPTKSNQNKKKKEDDPSGKTQQQLCNKQQEPENILQLIESDIKEAFMDVENLKVEAHLIIKAFNEFSKKPFEDARLPFEETPEVKILNKMLVSPYTQLFTQDNGQKGKRGSITLASTNTVLYREMLNPMINLNVISQEESEMLTTLKFDIFLYKDRGDEYHAYMLLMSMFYYFGLPNTFKIPDSTLYRFFYTVSKRYRNVPFHNFYHAFNVTQTLFFFLTTCQASKLFGPLEILCLLIAAICHDCDHPGLNNDFQRKAQTKVYNMHKKSVLENHHYLHCMSILALPETNILANLTQEQEDIAYNYLRDLILATDLAVHGVILKSLKERNKVLYKHFKNGTQASMLEEDKKLMMCAVLKCSDLSNEIRKQSISSKWAKLVFDEFISQADKEKEMELEVSPWMDKERIIVAKEQMNFIEKLCLPLYELVSQVLPDVSSCCQRLEENRSIWQRRLILFCEDKKADIKKLGPNKSLWENKQVKDKGNLSSTLATLASNPEMVHKRSRTKLGQSTGEQTQVK